jgi:nitroreductase
MDVQRAIATKRAVRRFEDRPLEREHLERILWAGHRAGSSKNLQRWQFIVCEDRAHLRDLSDVGDYAGHLAGAAAGIALVTPDPRTTEPLSVMWDLGGVAAYMMLTAWDLGIGSVPATVYDQRLARRLLGYPDDYWCEFLLSFGYPTDPAVFERPNKRGGRRPLEPIVHRERW